MPSSSLCTSDEEEELKTPKKRRYRRSLFHGTRKRKRPTTALTLPKATSQYTETQHFSSDDDFSVEQFQRNSDENATGFDSDISFSSENDVSSELSGINSTSEFLSSEESVFSLSDESPSEDSKQDSDEEQNVYMQEDEPLYESAPHSVLTSYVTIMLFVMKHSLTKEAFSDLLLLIQSHMPKPCKFTTSVYRLKQFLKARIGFQEPLKHYVCDTCGTSLMAAGRQCIKTSCRPLNSKALVFHDLRLEKQLEELFKDEVFCKLVLEKKGQKPSTDDLKDISDGSEYRRITSKLQFDAVEKNITFTLNTDGVALFSSSHKGSLWPVYLAVNELPVKLRFSKKYLITTNLYCHPDKPNMLSYLSPLMDTLKKLHCEGLKVKTFKGELLVRCHLLAVSLDLPAKAAVLNTKQFNGKFGCSYCEDEGANPPNRPMLRYYPYSETFVPRQHQSMVNDMKRAITTGETVKGIKGASPVIVLKYIELPKTFVIDWMHSVLLGVVKTLLNLWCNATYKDKTFYIGDKMALINQRLMGIQVPDYITRQQRNLEDHKHWKASECREWLLHYSVPIIAGIQKSEITLHYALLVSAMFKLNKESVSKPEVKDAENLIEDFCKLFPTFYENEKQTMNIHLLRHLPQFVMLHGPLFHYSCFGFESMNNHLKNMVHGTRFINDQICFAVGMAKCMPDLVKSLMTKADSRVRTLMQRLGSVLESNNVSDCGSKALGVIKVHVLTDVEKKLFEVEPQEVGKAYRVHSSIGVVYSEEYKRTQNKNSYSVLYKDKHKIEQYGSVKYFLKTPKDLYAVVNKFRITKCSLLDFDDVRNHILKKHRDLCPQYKQLHEQQAIQLELVPVRNISAKCVFIACQKRKQVISVPPNMLEHN